MAHHAHIAYGDLDSGIASALAFGERTFGLVPTGNPDVVVLRYGLCSVDDARAVFDTAYRAPLLGEKKLIVLAVSRFFHEAQNALLKLFEEPPATTHLILIVPAPGVVLETLRSRVVPLPGHEAGAESILVTTFLQADEKERAKMIEKLVQRSKSDAQEEKQRARSDAVTLAEGLLRHAYALPEKDASTMAFLADLSAFMPILFERSAPLKLIFEHLLLTLPAGLSKY